MVSQDPTGTIHGSVHYRVLEEHGADVNEGAVLILRNVSVFSPKTELCHYVNVVPRNVVRRRRASEPRWIPPRGLTSVAAACLFRAHAQVRVFAPTATVAAKSVLASQQPPPGSLPHPGAR